MIIRNATFKDILEVSKYIPAFYEEFGPNPMGDAYNYDADEFVHQWYIWLKEPNYVLFVAYEHDKFIGGLGGMISKHPYTENTLTGVEHFWYVVKEKRKSGVGKELIDTFEAWLKVHGATYMMMVYIHGGPSEMMAKFYEKEGFVPFETQVIKRLLDSIIEKESCKRRWYKWVQWRQ